MTDVQRLEQMQTGFALRYGSLPELWVRAPGRVDLMGSHTDYNEGYVLTLPIDRDTWIAARPRADGWVAIESLNLGGGCEFDLQAVQKDARAPWTNYVRGVAAILRQEGYPLTGFDGLVHSTIPLSSGLSSSAALEAATLQVFQALGGWRIEPVQQARLCQRAENEFVGVNCGILDQYTSILGQPGCALLLDCRDLTSRGVEVPAEISIVICDTRAKRQLAGTEYAERRAECEAGVRQLAGYTPHVRTLRDITVEELAANQDRLPPSVARRCRFIVEENRRVLDMAAALPAADRRQIAGLTARSYAGARDLYEINSREMSWMMTAMLGAPGVIGARQAGAGFGGCMLAFVERAQTGPFRRHVEGAYAAAGGLTPGVYVVQPAPGAGLASPLAAYAISR